MPRTAIIVGAGPAGLTAAYELLQRTDVKPIVLEMSSYMGGISRTVNYKGNRIDIGGHRFFSKSDRVMEWWLDIMPMEEAAPGEVAIAYQGQTRKVTSAVRAKADDELSMLVRNRKSRIYFLRRFFDYPITLSADTVRKLGLWRVWKMGWSYLRAMLFPINPESNLEEFFINRFGRELYQTFFKSYTEKVWGQECRAISAEWGAQRIKGLSIVTALKHAFGKLFKKKGGDVAQKGTETSLIERFLYPKLGPGQMWEEVARRVTEQGGEILTGWRCVSLERTGADGMEISAIVAKNDETGETRRFEGDYFFSTMPVKELVNNLQGQVPNDIQRVANGLMYRDFVSVGLLVKKLKIADDGPQGKKLIADNWIYIQEPDVKLGRLQVFNNWSPHLVAKPDTVWLGLEYFCQEGDALWNLSDAEMIALGKAELAKIDIIAAEDALDATVIRMPKTYPAYFGTYNEFDKVRGWLDGIENLVLIGRNGMHRYNNQDHSMLTAMVAVDGIAAGRIDKAALWTINTEQEYHEAKDEAKAPPAEPRQRPPSRELAAAK